MELLFHYTHITDLLHLCFLLGHFGRLPLVVCRFLLLWSSFAENGIVLSNISCQFGPSLFVLRHFFLLGVGLGLDMKWPGVAKFFGPTMVYIYREKKVLMIYKDDLSIFLRFKFFYFLSLNLKWTFYHSIWIIC